MTLRQLESFLAIVRAGSFRRAAERLALSQPALSQQIKELERELETPLFDRLGRSVRPTAAGMVLETHVQRVLAAIDGAREAMRALRGLERGSLVLAASTTPGIYLLPRLLAGFKRAHPHLVVALRIANTREVEELIRRGEADLGIVGGHLAEARETCVEARLVDRIVLIVPPGHRWAGKREIAPARLREECLLTREDGSATRQVTEAALTRAGVSIDTRLELGHTEAIKEAVRAGLGVALVSQYAVQSEVAARQLRSLMLRGLPIERHFHVIRHDAKSLSAVAQAFLGFLHEHSEVGHAAPGRRPGRGVRRG
jgi:DNA-binding transcriptional LysR family regulator